jgi:H+/Cl- antiporter ClcA
MGMAFVGTAYVLELERHHGARITRERLIAALVGGFVGWGLDRALGLQLIRLVVPQEPPHSLRQAILTALVVGFFSGAFSALTGAMLVHARTWKAHPGIRLVFGTLILAGAALALAVVAMPRAAAGPGAGAITWVETASPMGTMILLVVVLRAIMTVAAIAANGCGGLFVPYLGIGDLAGRAIASPLPIPLDLAGASGAASGIAAGYRLPITAVAIVLSQGGPPLATLTCLATVCVATFVGSQIHPLVNRAISFGEHGLHWR